MFITFEGIDGCGKTTQLEMAADYLEDNGASVLKLREPGGSEFSEKIRDLLLHYKYELEPESELFLFEAARADLVAKVIKPALNKGKIVLCDRFFDSTTAYQGGGRELPLDLITRINDLAAGSLEPDMTFFFDVSLETSKGRSKNKRKDRIENNNDDFFKRTVEIFKKIAEREPNRFVVFNGEEKPEIIHENILKILKNRLKWG